MPRAPIPTWTFAVCVVRRADRYLLVQEVKDEQSWYFPAGRVQPGESLQEGARREALEESGLPIHLDGLLRLEYSPRDEAARLRAIFLASPADQRPPRTSPNHHSLGAGWFSLTEVEKLPLRSSMVLELLRAVAAGCPVYPLSVLGMEGQER
jgi:phosphatase NudJ